MPTLTQRFGLRVKSIRKSKGISQLKLSEEANLDLTTINEIENGNREPLLRTIWKIALALGVKPYELLNFDTKN